MSRTQSFTRGIFLWKWDPPHDLVTEKYASPSCDILYTHLHEGICSILISFVINVNIEFSMPNMKPAKGRKLGTSSSRRKGGSSRSNIWNKNQDNIARRGGHSLIFHFLQNQNVFFENCVFKVFCCLLTVLLGIFSFEEAPSLSGTVTKGHKCKPKQK